MAALIATLALAEISELTPPNSPLSSKPFHLLNNVVLENPCISSIVIGNLLALLACSCKSNSVSSPGSLVRSAFNFGGRAVLGLAVNHYWTFSIFH